MVPGGPSKDFVAITLDIPPAVFTVLGAWPENLALRPQFVQFLPGFDMTKFDKMPTYALALMRANTEYKTATETPASVAALANSAIETRRVLLADLNSLISRGLVVGLREQAPQIVAEAVRNRNAAFTLFITTYEEIRAAVGYLRRQEGDAAGITLTLYTGVDLVRRSPWRKPG